MKKKYFKNLINEKKSNFRNLKCEFQKFNYEKNLCQKLAQFCHIMTKSSLSRNILEPSST